MSRVYRLLLLLFVIISCNKSIFDYRTKYTGSFEFVVHKTTWDTFGNTSDTVYSTSGEINISQFSENEIEINLSHGYSRRADIYEDGTISYSSSLNSVSGEFESINTVRITMSARSSGGGSTYQINGERNESK